MNVLKDFKVRLFFSKDYDTSGWLFFIFYVFRTKVNLILFNYLIQLFCRIKGVHLGSHIKFNGYPIINRLPDSKISIGDNCKFHSSKKSVAIHLKRRCTIVTLREGAEISIGKNSGFTGTTIAADYKITIGENVLVGAYCTIIDNDFHNPDPAMREVYKFPEKPVLIEDNVFIGMNCFILKGVTIGKNSVIAANSVVVTSIPPNSFAMGNPCKVVVIRNWENAGSH